MLDFYSEVNQYDLFFTGAFKSNWGRVCGGIGRTAFMASLSQSDSLWFGNVGLRHSTDLLFSIWKRSERRHMAACIPCNASNDVPSRSLDSDVFLLLDSVLLFCSIDQKPDVGKATPPTHPPSFVVHFWIDHRVPHPVFPS